METKRIPIYSILEDHQAVEEAAALLRAGGVVAIPTETVYGLAANAYDGQAVSKIFEAKGRPADNPLIVHISEFDMLPDLVEDLPEEALELARLYWPGPLTIILPKSDKIPDQVSAGLPTVAVRMPAHTVARGIIGACGFPLAAPSANRSGSPSPTTAAHVLQDMDGRIDGVVVSGDAQVGVESTVISLAGLSEGKRPLLLRPGAVTPQMLRAAVGEIDMDPAIDHQMEEGRQAPSPGLKYKHYAPKARVVLVEGDGEQYRDYVNRQAAPGVCALCFEEEGQGLSLPVVTYGRAADPDSQARSLFDALRRLDEAGYGTAYAHAPAKDGVGLAVYNRLVRAAAFQVVRLAEGQEQGPAYGAQNRAEDGAGGEPENKAGNVSGSGADGGSSGGPGGGSDREPCNGPVKGTVRGTGRGTGNEPGGHLINGSGGGLENGPGEEG